MGTARPGTPFSPRIRRLGTAAAVASLVLAGPVFVQAAAADTPSTERAKGWSKVPAQVETVKPHGDQAAADDPAIWVSPSDPTQSVVFGSIKIGGIDAYDLSGALIQHLDPPAPPGGELKGSQYNNLDVIQGAAAAGFDGDLVVVTDRGRDRLRIFLVDPRGAATPGGKVLVDITDPDAPRVYSATEEAVEDQLTAYGLALRMTAAGAVQAIVTQRNTTRLGMFQFVATAGGHVSYVKLDTIRMPASFVLPDGTRWYPCTEEDEPPKLEGMVVDQRTQVLYAAQEEVGIWRFDLGEDRFTSHELVELGTKYGLQEEWDDDLDACVPVGDDPGLGGDHLVYQVEGLNIAYEKSGKATLVASSQGDNTFALFRLGAGSDWTWYRQIKVNQSAATDGVSQTDGIAVVTTPLGSAFPHGLLVVQDGHNHLGDKTDVEADPHLPRTNFKYVRWEDARG